MVMLPAEDVEQLRAEERKNLENWQRERADFLNYKKRIERDQHEPCRTDHRRYHQEVLTGAG